jgi:hypothetical protein
MHSGKKDREQARRKAEEEEYGIGRDHFISTHSQVLNLLSTQNQDASVGF